MAQLPPKVPTMTQNWPDFSHPKENMATTNARMHNHSWPDDFLDFSSAKRGSHRRSISDSIAFLEVHTMEECTRPSIIPIGSGNNTSEFDKFDEDQFMSMFNDDVELGPIMSCSNPSSPSDHNSINDDHKQGLFDMQKPKREPEEVQSSCNSEGTNGQPENSSEKISDPKRIRRILANRQSAQRSRVRKLQYISELERSVTSLQAEVSVLSPRVAFLDHQRLVLNVDNSVLKQRIAALAQDKVFKDAHQEALKREIERLRQIHYQQNHNKMLNAASPAPKSPAMAADTDRALEKEQLVN